MTGCEAALAGGPEQSFTASLLGEIAHLLGQLAASGTGGAIDLRSLPLQAADREALERALGRGEVEARLTTAGGSEVFETTYPGVWWVRHRGADGRISSETIEVTLIPEILKTHADDLAGARGRLAEAIENRLFEFQAGEVE